jgi:CHASE3 domain sensor protein
MSSRERIERGRTPPLTLKNKTNIAFIAALVTLAVIGWFSVQSNRSTEEMVHWVSHSRDVLEASELLRSDVFEAAANRRAFTLWADPTKLDAFHSAYQSVQSDFETLRELTVDNSGQQASLSQIEPVLRQRMSLLKDSVESHQNSTDDAKKQSVFNDQSARVSSQLTELLDVFDRSEKGLLQQRTVAAQAGSQRKTMVNEVLGVSVFFFLIARCGS